jgi:hypothetical protein
VRHHKQIGHTGLDAVHERVGIRLLKQDTVFSELDWKKRKRKRKAVHSTSLVENPSYTNRNNLRANRRFNFSLLVSTVPCIFRIRAMPP